ncbi:hypothetical protein CN894_11725 [Bacillus thuringiensis]|uniref:CDP-alcohol phosphatidyltransferase family protein n=1 Tax=Bacillus thuringiensis TaxID=1428 RepID=UPI000BFC69BE|nr:CDP-alcohol phosphatidyltransferase family protein [Bacillus thuringiensis]PGH72148.1 hypothetical protein CN894_11725 [Bacillus thuringiensis]
MEEKNIKALRKELQDVSEAPTWRATRWISIYVTRVLLSTSVTPNMVTGFHFMFLLAASICLAQGRQPWLWVGVSFIFTSYVVDCVDGELARGKELCTFTGGALEEIVHFVGGSIVLLGATYGASKQGFLTAWPIGIAAICGGLIFEFGYARILEKANPEVSYGWLYNLTKGLILFMPLNTNILAIGGLTGYLFPSLTIWACVSNLAWIIASILYYKAERKNYKVL